jgi:hypothetical protein
VVALAVALPQLWRSVLPAASIDVMTDLLQSILADPELLAWPRVTTNTPPPVNTTEASSDIAAESISAPPQPPACGDRQAAIEKMRKVVAITTESETDGPQPDLPGTPTAPPAIQTANNEPHDRTSDQPDPAQAGAHQPDSDEQSAPPMAFDDIAAKPNAITTRITVAAQWLKTRDWKNPKTVGLAAAAAVTVATLSYWGTHSPGHNDASRSAQIAPSDESPTTRSQASTQIPQDAPIAVITADAHCPAPSSDPMNAIRSASGQFWKCVRAWQLDGQLLELTFDKAYLVTAVSLMPGANVEVDGQDQWAKYRTVTRLSWKFNDAGRTSCTQTTDNARKLVTLNITAANCHHKGAWQPVVASTATVTIEKTSEPSNPNSVAAQGGSAGADYTAFAVSHLELVGYPAG